MTETPNTTAEITADTTETVDVAIERPKTKRLGRGKVYARRFFRNIPAVVGLCIFGILTIWAIVGEHLTHWGINEIDWDADPMSQPPSAAHWFGTKSGFDIFAQVSHGLSRSLIIGVTVSICSVLLSAFIGAATAYFGGWTEKVILWIIHFLLVIPGFLILAIISAGNGGKMIALIIAMIALGWMYSARVIWSLSISIREREYVMAARYMGVSGVKTVWRHIIPNIGSLLVLQFAMGIVGAIMSETGLSFLGFGIKPPDISLGAMIGDGTQLVVSSPWAFYFPAGVLTALTISSAFVADGLRDALDPNSAAGGRA